MASRKFLGVFLAVVLVVLVEVNAEAEAEADAWAEAFAEAASCCSRPTTFVKGAFIMKYTLKNKILQPNRHFYYSRK